MFAKTFTAGIVGSTLLATAAFAQTPSTDTTTTAPAATTSTTSSSASTNSSYSGNWRTSKVVGLNVYNDGNESLGAINDLLTDKSGKIVAVIVGVGGFLGVGERYVAIPFEKVKFVNEPVPSSMAGNSGATGSRPASTGSTTTGAAGGGMATTPSATTTATTANPWYPDHAVISGTKDELKALPEFKYNNS